MNKKDIKKAVQIIKKGGVVVYPTDTAYAIGGKFNSPKVIEKILKIKKRQDEKFTLIASSLYQVEKYFKLNKYQKKAAKKYWPGPTSIIVSNKYAVRVPKSKLARDLAKHVGFPLIATSANISKQKTIYNINNLKLKGFDYIINNGVLPKRPVSAILDCSSKKIKKIR